ncbi:hypothetical protein Y032_0161g3362 [Ancylostoma ceylanicum]|uniref:Uncharacterized protein n=1 Tax=Ancylostoma ceylanicum TaxID=53326 RepID=A0A016SYA1_9BILA|nr:hypothetical protein Y032_0161g3362 [Ancylostoma ceylanicum]
MPLITYNHDNLPRRCFLTISEIVKNVESMMPATVNVPPTTAQICNEYEVLEVFKNHSVSIKRCEEIVEGLPPLLVFYSNRLQPIFEPHCWYNLTRMVVGEVVLQIESALPLLRFSRCSPAYIEEQ